MSERLPPELFERILTCLTDPLDDEPVRITENKHTLSRWSLTCRFWARHCRPYLYWKLMLRSREDALAFCQFVKSSTDGTPIGHYVWQLSLHQQCPTVSIPWIHLILLSVSRSLLPHLERQCIYLGPDEPVDSTTTAYPIQYGLPTSYPNPRLPSLAFGTLQNIRCHAFKEFARILCSIPAHMLELRGLSWSDGLSLFPDVPSSFRTAVRLSPNFRCTGFNISDCTAAWPFMLFCLSAGPPPRVRKGLRPVFLDPDELPVVLMLTRLVMDDCKCAACKSHSPNSRTYHIKLHKLEDNNYISVVVWVPGAEVHRITFVVSTQGQISSIHFAPWSREDTSEMTFDPSSSHYDWDTLDLVLAQFGPFMTEFVVKADDTSDRIVQEYVESRMPFMQDAGKLQFSPRGSLFDFP